MHLDVVAASVHSGLNMPRTEMTNRVLAALHNDQVDILGHPTGRIIQQRDPVQMDLDVVFDAAVEHGVSREGSPLASGGIRGRGRTEVSEETSA